MMISAWFHGFSVFWGPQNYTEMDIQCPKMLQQGELGALGLHTLLSLPKGRSHQQARANSQSVFSVLNEKPREKDETKNNTCCVYEGERSDKKEEVWRFNRRIHHNLIQFVCIFFLEKKR